jgi:thymidine kinase
MIELILGPMYSGKTTELFRRLERHQIAKKKVLMLRPDIDTRRKLTHDGLHSKTQEESLPWMVQVASVIDSSTWQDYDVIGIDEGQFFPSFVQDIIHLHHKHIIISALNGTSERTPWPTIQEIIPYVNQLDFLSAVCMHCGQDAHYSYFFGGKKDSAVKVGGEGEYQALCGQCYDQAMTHHGV